MITGTLKQKINAIWQDFYNANMAQTSDIVNQLTMLMFINNWGNTTGCYF